VIDRAHQSALSRKLRFNYDRVNTFIRVNAFIRVNTFIRVNVFRRALAPM
jgi:hypothetical protein